ncbi:hypothetical protein L3Q65_00995 (plasmid) [Amycolatopsis sp. FU40]|uniref:hypothetical protein n=1 Tax=Amycolatopsis sp. FU40 TaxID=2914159 RepID=UPI001F400945|nr:hypothetical protein [Amycolatopsis sp. FU40]UKD50902.1 hypothetical protein L3Q65_00995 [Amycolatopsis sp. FU40]
MTAQPDQRGDIRAALTPECPAGDGLCTDRLQPSPPDTEHDGWHCTRPPGHTKPDAGGTAHRAQDGTEW